MRARADEDPPCVLVYAIMHAYTPGCVPVACTLGRARGTGVMTTVSFAEELVLKTTQRALGREADGFKLGNDDDAGTFKFVATMTKYKAPKEVEANAALMVRFAGVTTAIMYGCETFGILDSRVDEVRCKVANAAILTLLAMDGSIACWTLRSMHTLGLSSTWP